MKKSVFLLAYSIFGGLFLYGFPLSLALLLSNPAVYGLLAMVGFVAVFVFLYWKMKAKDMTTATTKRNIYFVALFSLFVYIGVLYFTWACYDWRMYVDNTTDTDVKLIVNNEVFSIPANSYTEYDYKALAFHCPALHIVYNGQNYHLKEAGDYVFNVDSLSSYYITRHEVEYHTPTLQNLSFSFSLKDSITETINRQMFFRLPHSIDYWYKYPEEIIVWETRNKQNEVTKRNEPKRVYSIRRIAEYDE